MKFKSMESSYRWAGKAAGFIVIADALAGNALAIDEMGAEMVAVPVPAGKAIAIDGDLSDWDLSAQEWLAVAAEVAERFNARVAVMYDDDFLYLSIDGHTGGGPLVNANKPSERPWYGHSVEFRCIANPAAPFPFSADSAQDIPHPNQKFYPFCKTVRLYQETVNKDNYLIIQHGPPYAGGDDVNPDGTQIAILEKADISRYVMEAKVPWSVLGVEGGKNPFKPGDSMTAFWIVLWPQMRIEFLTTTPAGGFGWAWHRMQVWGQIKFSGENHLPPRHGSMDDYLAQQKITGGTPIEFTLPSALKASVSIVDKEGAIVRELIGGEPRPEGKNTVYWDGYDWQGNPMPPGEYTWKVYASPGLTPVFVGAAGTAGNPVHGTPDGRGGWGGDHGEPIAVAADATGTYFLWNNNEASKAFVKVGNDDVNLWRNNAFVEGGFGPYTAIASNGKYVYVMWGGKKTYMSRFNALTGLAEPFSREMPTLVVNDWDPQKTSVNAWFSFEEERFPRPETIGLAATETEIFASAYSKHKIFVYDAETGEKKRELDCAWPRGLALDANGNLYAVSAGIEWAQYVTCFPQGQGQGYNMLRFSYKLRAPWGIATDPKGERFYVTDSGDSHRVWIYRRDGTHEGWIGKRGGRAPHGLYDPEAMLHPTGIVMDNQGRLVIAQTSIPSVFQRYAALNSPPLEGWRDSDGVVSKDAGKPPRPSGTPPKEGNERAWTLEHEWQGDIAYGPPTWPSAKDPLTIYIRYKEGTQILRARLKGDGSVGKIDAYWDLKRMGFPYPFDGDNMGWGIPANILGPRGIEFMFTDAGNHPHDARLIFRVENDTLVPVAYVRSLAEQRHPNLLENEGIGLELWADFNHNGKVDDDEITLVRELAGEKLVHNFNQAYSFWMNEACDIFLASSANKIYKIPAKSVDKKGAIRWDIAKAILHAKDIMPGQDTSHSAPRDGILGFRDDGKGNLYAAFNINNHSTFKYASKEWEDAMRGGLGWTGNYKAVKVTKYNQKGERTWMAGRKATAVAKPGQIYHTWVMAGLVGDGYSVLASEWTPMAFYTHDGFFVDSIIGDPNLGELPSAYHIGGGENFTGRAAWFKERGEVYAYTGSAFPNVYRVDGFGKDGKVKGEIRFEGRMTLEKHTNPYPPQDAKEQDPLRVQKLNAPLETQAWGNAPATLVSNNGDDLAKINVGYDETYLYARFDVKDTTPMENQADDEKLVFKKGDCVGLSFGKAQGGATASSPSRTDNTPQPGDIRLLATEFQGKPVVVAMIPFATTLSRPTEYYTPSAGRWNFAFVGVLDDATVRFTKQPGRGYVAEMKVPLSIFEGLSFTPGASLLCEAEVLLSGFGQRGFQTLSRNHLFTPRSAVSAKMVDDIPCEARLYPQHWGAAIVE